MEVQRRDFYGKINYFNHMYKLPMPDHPTVLDAITWQQEKFPIAENDSGEDYLIDRLRSFRKILCDEVAEVDTIIMRLRDGTHLSHGARVAYLEMDVLTDLADWLGDITVFCVSEARRYGIPMDKVLHTIMDSNFSKLGTDGQPIYDKDGKVQKGPFYWKPEIKIKEVLVQEFYSYHKKVAGG